MTTIYLHQLTQRLNLPRQAHRARGFSLLELAIALGIIAVLSGGFIKGRELLLSSRVQGVIDQLQGTETAIAAFETKFNALPGDFANANGAVTGSAGNESGAIDTSQEAGSVFAHLSSAGLIKGTYTATNLTSTCPKTACPPTSFGGTLTVSTGNNRVSNGTESAALEINTGNQIPAKQLAELDRKFDDGNPRTGNFRASSDEAYASCITQTGWNEGTNPKSCAGVYVVQ
jgi:prepilin-type N-terminal cleavage/methylation domain-containing protein